MGTQTRGLWTQQEIADALGLSKGAVSQWIKRGREGGVEGLKRRVASGAPPRLGEEQREMLVELLAYDAQAYGFRGKVWTCQRVADLIGRRFGVRYHPAHVSRLFSRRWDFPYRSPSAERTSATRKP